MTKISKILTGAAALGVLGVAALPLASFAGDVILSVQVMADNDPGTCIDADCTGGGNNGNGYTVTIADKDGSKFNLANKTLGTSDNPITANDDGTASPLPADATKSIPTIVAKTATIPVGGGYGVKYQLAPGTYTGSYVISTGISSTSDGTTAQALGAANSGAVYGVVSASIGTIATGAPGVFTVSINGASGWVDYAPTTEPGTYTNTISVTFTANP